MSEGQQSKSQNIFGFLLDEFRGAIQNIRQKVVEEGWFGRVVTAAPVIEVDHTLGRGRGGLYSDDHRPLTANDADTTGRRPSFEESWRARVPGEAPDNTIKDHSVGIDH